MASDLYKIIPQPRGDETLEGESTIEKENKTIDTMKEANELVREFP